MERDCSFNRRMPELTMAEAISEAPRDYQIDLALGTDIDNIPQNQQLIREANPPRALSFVKGDAHYGKSWANFKSQDEEHWLGHSGKIISHAQNGSSAAKRMFLELRNIRAAKVPFVSAVPLDDSLDRIWASIERPPEMATDPQLCHCIFETVVAFQGNALARRIPGGEELCTHVIKIFSPQLA